VLIDLETMPRPRVVTPQISFRRTDADRRPASVFVRPNDYALTIEEREAESARRLEMLNAKRLEAQRIFVERMDAAKSNLTGAELANSERLRVQGMKTALEILAVINSGSNTLREIRSAIACSEGNARRVFKKLEVRGWVNVEIVADPEAGRSARAHYFTITPSGVQALKTNGGQS
jgi:hypothetical protein